MHDIELRRPRLVDVEELHQFFSAVIKDTFAKEGLADLLDDIEHEYVSKQQYLKSDLDSSGRDRYFLIAVHQQDKQVIGTVECGPVSELIKDCTGQAWYGEYEIGTLYVHPNYQGRGIGTLLLNVMLLTLQSRGIDEFCLDSGYKSAQKIWMKKLGEPAHWLKDHWGEGEDHMIWRKNINELPLTFKA
ncbi:GNAT family N-acetyltransferase [Paenibacillus sp. 481]|uniref:GNAT family N-acetyltransferase n=1 Tax=Paenibacillus sp. 481 TaxID=2835869 RepID=UPI001E39A652|nr:GNAT family N-acetyltransferase [Paenibacillus sp. 481]UHA76111.1 GNAT family N-acetyltransferase [Paenibacillus sp. 481]